MIALKKITFCDHFWHPNFLWSLLIWWLSSFAVNLAIYQVRAVSNLLHLFRIHVCICAFQMCGVKRNTEYKCSMPAAWENPSSFNNCICMHALVPWGCAIWYAKQSINVLHQQHVEIHRHRWIVAILAIVCSFGTCNFIRSIVWLLCDERCHTLYIMIASGCAMLSSSTCITQCDRLETLDVLCFGMCYIVRSICIKEKNRLDMCNVSHTALLLWDALCHKKPTVRLLLDMQCKIYTHNDCSIWAECGIPSSPKKSFFPGAHQSLSEVQCNTPDIRWRLCFNHVEDVLDSLCMEW